jgi:hypothetical protein
MGGKRIRPVDVVGFALTIALTLLTLFPWWARIRYQIKRIIAEGAVELSGGTRESRAPDKR